MRNGGMFENKIREGSHDETKAGRRRNTGKSWEPLRTAGTGNLPSVMIGI